MKSQLETSMSLPRRPHLLVLIFLVFNFEFDCGSCFLSSTFFCRQSVFFGSLGNLWLITWTGFNTVGLRVWTGE
jgi:hypothetical protein